MVSFDPTDCRKGLINVCWAALRKPEFLFYVEARDAEVCSWCVVFVVLAVVRGRELVAAPAPQGKTPAPEKEISFNLGRGVKLELVLIPSGEFLMGSPDSDKDAAAIGKPRHRVRITKPFYLGKYLVTQELWQAVLGYNPSVFRGPKSPVENVTWDWCQNSWGS